VTNKNTPHIYAIAVEVLTHLSRI